MESRFNQQEDGYDVDFDDNRQFAIQQWEEAVFAVEQSLTSLDLEKVTEPRKWATVLANLRRRVEVPGISPITKRLLVHIVPLPRTLATLVGSFTKAVQPQEPNFNILWGLIELNITLSSVSNDKLSRTAGWSKRLRSVAELFNRCIAACDDANEARYAMVEVFEILLQILGESIRHLRQCPTDLEATKAWKNLEIKINENLTQMEAVVKHLNDITSYSMVNLERNVKNLAIRHAPAVVPEESCTFPISMLPRNRNLDFYGRHENLERIDHYLDYRDNNRLRTYTIYGRRGVGKTDIALQYAHTNPSQFDAIFWIQCETSVSLRQSFTDTAVQLNLPGADRNGHHEENQLAVQNWLRTTKRNWLLIFDNAESESILRGYWPVGASGAILITSRKYYNFMNDASRKGDTVKPFNERESWDLLMKLLGEDWVDMDRRGLIKASEELAAKELLKDLGGLALAIQQAAELIKDPYIAGTTINSFYETYKHHRQTLPPRQSRERSAIIHSLDSLWSITFNSLSRNARDLLSVLSLLSPDGILIDLFLPKNQKALEGKLAFCKQPAYLVDPHSQATLSSVIRPPPALQDAIAELVKLKLIKQEGREFWAHRVVQEAMNYHSVKELQDYFDSASYLVYEAFPKQMYGDSLSNEQRGACQSYLSHGAQLSFQFSNIQRFGVSNTLKGSPQFITLLSNCAWYLYEVSDYALCLKVVDTGWLACEDKESLQYGDLCFIAGSALYELNRVGECRKNWENYRNIQAALLPEDGLERSNSFHVMGNLEFAAFNLNEAMDYFKRAIAIRSNAGDKAAILLASSYLCMSRVFYLRGEYDEAVNLLAQSEALYFRTAGADAHFMVHVHYAYGNIEFAQKRWLAAKRAYDASLKIGLQTAPIHPITAAAYYSLGCVEFERRNLDNANAYLDKALAISELRSPSRDDGSIARILWKKSVVLESDTFGTYAKEAEGLRIRAEVALKTLTGNGEGQLTVAVDNDDDADIDEVEDSFDALVPGFFR